MTEQRSPETERSTASEMPLGGRRGHPASERGISAGFSCDGLRVHVPDPYASSRMHRGCFQSERWGPLVTRNRFIVPIGLAFTLALACSSGDRGPASIAAAGAAGQGQAGSAGSNSAGSNSAGSNSAGSSTAATAGAASLAGAAGSSSGGGLPGIALSDCTGKEDGSICDPAAGFVSASGAFCEHETCHMLDDFVIQCWNLVPTCPDGQSFGVFDYALMLASEKSCPADATCVTKSLAEEDFPFSLIDCGKVMPTSCAANELSSGAMSSPGTHQGKVRCRSFTLEETYCQGVQ
jgi:hypothetical protein